MNTKAIPFRPDGDENPAQLVAAEVWTPSALSVPLLRVLADFLLLLIGTMLGGTVGHLLQRSQAFKLSPSELLVGALLYSGIVLCFLQTDNAYPARLQSSARQGDGNGPQSFHQSASGQSCLMHRRQVSSASNGHAGSLALCHHDPRDRPCVGSGECKETSRSHHPPQALTYIRDQTYRSPVFHERPSFAYAGH